jgi:NAD(P)-dependent dehydrogenase (short-subunit alcohol dehydrogenase family)
MPPAAWRVDGMRVLVTGGTKGIGAAFVEEMCSLGASVFLCARSGVPRAVADFHARGLVAVAGVDADVSTSAGRAALVHAVEQHFGSVLDVFFSNVGTNIRHVRPRCARRRCGCELATLA